MRTVTIQSVLGVAASAMLSMSWFLTGCSIAGDDVLPSQLESRVVSNGSIDDHMAAAALYQQQAHRLQAEADRYEQQAAAINQLEDPKGFRRNALIMTAHQLRKDAGEMQQLYASHFTKAQTMAGKLQQQ
jgi:hypothetical protein